MWPFTLNSSSVFRAPARAVWFTVGLTALAIGGIGVVLPVLPTTPFVILAAFAFGKSSPALARWLEESKTFGPIIADWREHGAIAPRFKVFALVMMAGAFLLSVAMSLSTTVLVIQAVCMAAAATFIISRPNGPDS